MDVVGLTKVTFVLDNLQGSQRVGYRKSVGVGGIEGVSIDGHRWLVADSLSEWFFDIARH